MIKIYRKVLFGDHRLVVELGPHWEITVTREALEDWNKTRIIGRAQHKLAFKKFVKEAGLIPRWYGYSYYDFDRDVSVAMPFPLNWIAAFWLWWRREVIWQLKWLWPKKLDEKRAKVRKVITFLEQLEKRIPILYADRPESHKFAADFIHDGFYYAQELKDLLR